MRTTTAQLTHDSLNVGRKPDYLPTSGLVCNQNRHLVCMSKKRATQTLVSCAYELTLNPEDWIVKDAQKALGTKVSAQYATPLPRLAEEVETLAARVDEHLKKMGFQP